MRIVLEAVSLAFAIASRPSTPQGAAAFFTDTIPSELIMLDRTDCHGRKP